MEGFISFGNRFNGGGKSLYSGVGVGVSWYLSKQSNDSISFFLLLYILEKFSVVFLYGKGTVSENLLDFLVVKGFLLEHLTCKGFDLILV